MPKPRRRLAFTLIEVLTVMAIISILLGLVIVAGSGAFERAKRARASAEIQAMSTALDAYKIDNGTYPLTNAVTGIGMPNGLLVNTAANPYSMTSQDGKGTVYIQNSQLLYFNLSGQTNFTSKPLPGTKAYMSFPISQVGDPNGTVSGETYVRDPWTYAYGYSTGTTNNPPTGYPYNGNGFFDLWSTAGTLTSKPNTNAWISNWQ